MNVHLHIDRVIVDAPIDLSHAALERAITAALFQRLDRGAPPATHDTTRRAADIDLGSGPAADVIADAVANAVLPGGHR